MVPHRDNGVPVPALIDTFGDHCGGSHRGERVVAELGEDVAGLADDPAGLGQGGAFAVDALLDLRVVAVVGGAGCGRGSCPPRRGTSAAPAGPAGTGARGERLPSEEYTVTSSPANRTALREEQNRSAPPSQQHRASAVIGPTPYSRLDQRLGARAGAGRCRSSRRRRSSRCASSHLQHRHGDGDLQLPGRRELLGGDLTQPLPALVGADPPLPSASARPDGTAPRGCAGSSRCAHGAGRGRAPTAPDTPTPATAGSSTPGSGPVAAAPASAWIGPVGLGPPLAAPRRRGVGRLGQMRLHPGRAAAPPPHTATRCSPPPRTATSATPANRRSHTARCSPVGRGDLPPPHLPRRRVDIVEGDLLPVDIQPAYDRHRDLLTLRDRLVDTPHGAPVLGRSPSSSQVRSASSAGHNRPEHVIFGVRWLVPWSCVCSGNRAPGKRSPPGISPASRLASWMRSRAARVTSR